MDNRFSALAKNLYEEAKSALDRQDFVEFISKISNAEFVADEELLPEISFLKVQGLYKFNQHKKALEYLPKAEQYNSKLNGLRLLSYKGIILGHLGNVEESKKVLKQLVNEAASDTELLVKACLSLAWVYLTVEKNNLNEIKLAEVKEYLDLAKVHFDEMPDQIKWRICNNFSVYYYFKDDHESAIDNLKEALQYCGEKDSPDVYINLAELYLESDDAGVAQCVHEYLHKAEVVATKYKNIVALGYAFYTKAMVELREDEVFTALDTLYLAFEYFRNAEAHANACDCLIKINQIMDEYKTSRLEHLKANLKEKLLGTSYFDQIK